MPQILLPFVVLAIILCIRYLFYLRTQRIAEEILEEFKGQSINLGDIFIRFGDRYSDMQIYEAILHLAKSGHVSLKHKKE